MVQELHVLRCFSCETFQSHIVKKTNKWECKICGVKQSIKKVYGRGSGKDCRIHTQKLNALKGLKEETESLSEQGEEMNEPDLTVRQMPTNENLYTSPKNISIGTSKWAEFIDESESGVYPNHITKPEHSSFKPSKKFKSKVQKRKIEDEIDNKEFRGYSEVFDSFDSSYSEFSTLSSVYSKKRKPNGYQKTKTSIINSYVSNNIVDSDGLNIGSQIVSGELSNKIDFKRNFRDQSGSTNHSECTRSPKEDKTNLSKIGLSQNKVNIQKKSNKVSLKWAKYLDDEEDAISISVNNSCKSESELGMKLKYHEDSSQGERSSDCLGTLCFQRSSSDNFGGMSFDDCESVSVTNFKKESSTDLGRMSPIHTKEVLFDHCVASSGMVKRSVNNFSLNYDSVLLPVSSCKESTSASSSSFDSRDNVQNDLLRNEPLKNKFTKEIDMTSLEEKFKFQTIPPLPVFEQNNDFSDSEFQLDF